MTSLCDYASLIYTPYASHHSKFPIKHKIFDNLVAFECLSTEVHAMTWPAKCSTLKTRLTFITSCITSSMTT